MFSMTQLFGLVVFMVGIGLLNLCTRWEREDFQKMRDPVRKWSYIDGGKQDERQRSATRGTWMTLAGTTCTFAGVVMVINLMAAA
ncbi:MAG: hypothetical protein ACE5ER_04870 [Nitrospinaceae bacterium]